MMLNNKVILTLLMTSTFIVKGCASQPAPNEKNGDIQIINQGKTVQTEAPISIPLSDKKGERAGILAGETLIITVDGEEDLSGTYTVDDKGAVILPLIGKTKLLNKSLEEAEKIIRDSYADGYLFAPKVSLVRETGVIKTEENTATNIMKLVAAEDNESKRKKTVKILRLTEDGKIHTYKKMLEADIEAGDVIIVQEKIY